MKTRSILLFFCFVSTCIACTSRQLAVEQKVTLPQVPDEWSSTSDRELTLFDSVECRLCLVLEPSVEALVHEALKHNRDLQVALHSIEETKALLQRSRSNFWPSIDFDLSKNRYENLSSEDGDRFSHYYAASFSTGWEVDLWGELRSASSAAREEFLSSKFGFEAARQSIAANVVLAWLAVVEAKRRFELTEKNVHVQSRRLSNFERRLDLGLVETLDVRLAHNNLANAQDNLYQRKTEYKSSLRRLEILLGRYPRAAIQSHDFLPTIETARFKTAPADILRLRPDLRARESALRAAGFRVNEAKKMLYPSLQFSGSYDHESDRLKNLFDFDDWLSSFTASLMQPIFRGGQLRANIERRYAQSRVVIAEYEQAALEAWEEVENYIYLEEILFLREESLQLAFIEATAAESLTSKKYENGLVTSFEYLSGQNRSIEAEDALIRIQVAKISNRVQLLLALGRPVVELNP